MKSSSPHVVVIEQDPNQRLLYEWELREAGYWVVSCPSATRAHDLTCRSLADVVVLDAGMSPEGIARTVGKMRLLFPHAAVVVQTASLLWPRHLQRGVGDAFLVKSPDLSKLKATVRSLVKERGYQHSSMPTSETEVGAPAGALELAAV